MPHKDKKKDKDDESDHEHEAQVYRPSEPVIAP